MLGKDSMHRTARFGLVAVFIAVFSFAALSLDSVTHTVRAQGDVLLDEQFNDNSNNWKLASTRNTKMEVDSGTLAIELSKSGAAGWATPDMTFPDDIDVEVDMATTATPDSGGWSSAVIIRANTRDLNSAFYQFEVDDTGLWAFVTRTAKGAEYKIQKSGKVSKWDATANNTLAVQARGTNFTFLVNGKKVGIFEDDLINNDPSSPKYLGLLVTTFEKTSSVTVAFSNLRVTDASQVSVQPTAPIKIKTPIKINKTPVITVSDVAFDEKFPTNNPNKWLIGKNSNGNIAIKNNALSFQINKESWFMWTFPKTKFPADIDMTATVLNPDPDPNGMWNYGIGVRGYTTDDQDYFYMFRVSGDSTWEFDKLEGSAGNTFIIEPTPLKTFHPEDENALRITVVGDHFEFFLNGKKLGEVDDESLEKQDEYLIFLTAGTYKDSDKLTANFTEVIVEAAQ